MIKNKKNVRDSNLELLRIFSILVIILHHYNVHGGSFNDLSVNNITFNLILTKLMSFGKFANNIFIIMTGYFMIKSKPNYKKLISLILEMFFYSITISLIFYGFNIIDFSLKGFIKSLIPILYNNWFLIYYLLLYLLIPILNFIIQKFDKQQMRNVIILLSILWLLIPTFTENAWEFTKHDYFILDYLVGSYIRLYYEKVKFNRNKHIKIIVCLFSLSFSLTLFIIFAGKQFDINMLIEKCSFLLTGDYSFLNFLIAIYTFLIFKDLNIKNNKYINFVSSSVLGIYLIHDNELIRDYLWTVFWPNTAFIGRKLYIVHMVCKVLLVFLICLIIDKIRMFLFGKLENKLSDKLYNLCKKIYLKLKKYSHLLLNYLFFTKNNV